MKRIVCDTGPLLHLREAGSLDALRAAGQIYIPPAVQRELVNLDSFWLDNTPGWVHIQPLETPSSETALQWLRAGLLDPGEAEALSLALQIRADWLLTDDEAARLIAQGQGIEVHGSLGVVLWAAATGHLERSEAERALEGLAKSSLWISSRILDEVRAALRQIFPDESNLP